MAWVTSDFPNSIWDGLSSRTARTSRSDNISPNHQDWDQIVAEMLAVQQVITDAGGGVSGDNIWTISTSEDLNNGDFVFIQANGTLKKADAILNPILAGIAIETKSNGELTEILTQGKYINLSWSLTPGAFYYLAEDGLMSTTPPNTGWVIQLGKAITTTGLDLNIQQSIKL